MLSVNFCHGSIQCCQFTTQFQDLSQYVAIEIRRITGGQLSIYTDFEICGIQDGREGVRLIWDELEEFPKRGNEILSESWSYTKNYWKRFGSRNIVVLRDKTGELVPLVCLCIPLAYYKLTVFLNHDIQLEENMRPSVPANFWFTQIGLPAYDSDDDDSTYEPLRSPPTTSRKRKSNPAGVPRQLKRRKLSHEEQDQCIEPEPESNSNSNSSSNSNSNSSSNSNSNSNSNSSSNSNSNSHEIAQEAPQQPPQTSEQEETISSVGPDNILNVDEFDEDLVRAYQEIHPSDFYPGAVITAAELMQRVVGDRSCANCSGVQDHICRNKKLEIRKELFSSRCSICCNAVGTNADSYGSVIVTGCLHAFCAHCWMTWLNEQFQRNRDPKCPMCNSTVPIPRSERQRIIETGTTAMAQIQSLNGEGNETEGLELTFASQTSSTDSTSSDNGSNESEEPMDLSGFQ